MQIDDIELTTEERALYLQLEALRKKLDIATLRKYGRLNPFYENLVNWEERGHGYRGKNVVVYGSTTIVGDVTIGDYTWIGPFCSVDGTGGLVIGAYCVLAAGAQVFTHDTAKWAISGGRMDYEYAPVEIGDYVFIGAHAIITRGVKIGTHSLIAANATVTHDVSPYSIVAGSPARRIGSIQIQDGKVLYQYDMETESDVSNEL